VFPCGSECEQDSSPRFGPRASPTEPQTCPGGPWSVSFLYPHAVSRVQNPAPTFNRDESADIIDLAASIEADTHGDDLGLSAADIRRIAAELGISEGSVDAAFARRGDQAVSTAKDNRKVTRRRMRFVRHALAFVVVVTGLAFIDAINGGGWWFFYIAGGWGIALALHGTRFATRKDGPVERIVARP
jgi:hypothetical protein